MFQVPSEAFRNSHGRKYSLNSLTSDIFLLLRDPKETWDKRCPEILMVCWWKLECKLLTQWSRWWNYVPSKHQSPDGRRPSVRCIHSARSVPGTGLRWSSYNQAHSPRKEKKWLTRTTFFPPYILLVTRYCTQARKRNQKEELGEKEGENYEMEFLSAGLWNWRLGHGQWDPGYTPEEEHKGFKAKVLRYTIETECRQDAGQLRPSWWNI